MACCTYLSNHTSKSALNYEEKTQKLPSYDSSKIQCPSTKFQGPLFNPIVRWFIQPYRYDLFIHYIPFQISMYLLELWTVSDFKMSLQYLPGTASLLEELDKRLMVLLRDGRTLIGYLRSVDQFANLVLHRCIERIHVGSDYGDIPRGVFIVRGENVVSWLQIKWFRYASIKWYHQKI